MNECELCGVRSLDVAIAVVKWRRGVPPFTAILRCRDHDACYHRVIEAGDEWPVDDRRTGLRLVDERP